MVELRAVVDSRQGKRVIRTLRVLLGRYYPHATLRSAYLTNSILIQVALESIESADKFLDCTKLVFEGSIVWKFN